MTNSTKVQDHMQQEAATNNMAGNLAPDSNESSAQELAPPQPSGSSSSIETVQHESTRFDRVMRRYPEYQSIVATVLFATLFVAVMIGGLTPPPPPGSDKSDKP